MNKTKIERLTNYYMGMEGMTERKLKNRLKKEEAKEEQEKNQKPVKEIVITIEWKKSSMWGHNPKAEAEVKFQDGTFQRSGNYTCSGCGYDKESTVISQIFNAYLKYILWSMEDKEIKNKPYGINLNYEFNPYYDGGIGTNCYYNISEFIGGKFERVSSGKSFDVYKFTMIENK